MIDDAGVNPAAKIFFKRARDLLTIDHLHVIDSPMMNGRNVDRVDERVKIDTMLMTLSAPPSGKGRSLFSDSFFRAFVRATRFIGCAR
jgi:hypothetical protein